jgi:hypothetical protein
MLRIISSCNQLHDGLLEFFEADSIWHHKYVCVSPAFLYVLISNRYPAIFALCDDVAEGLRQRPNFFMSTDWQALKVFATFKSFSLLPGSVFGSNTG